MRGIRSGQNPISHSAYVLMALPTSFSSLLAAQIDCCCPSPRVTKVSPEVAADSKEWRREGGSNCDIPLCGTVCGRKRDCRVGRSRSRRWRWDWKRFRASGHSLMMKQLVSPRHCYGLGHVKELLGVGSDVLHLHRAQLVVSSRGRLGVIKKGKNHAIVIYSIKEQRNGIEVSAVVPFPSSFRVSFVRSSSSFSSSWFVSVINFLFFGRNYSPPISSSLRPRFCVVSRGGGGGAVCGGVGRSIQLIRRLRSFPLPSSFRNISKACCVCLA